MENSPEIFEYLKYYKESYFKYQRKHLFSGKHIFENHIDNCIEILRNYFGDNYLNIKRRELKHRKTGIIAEENWLIYHLAQSQEHFGSFLIILELADIIYFYLKQNKDVIDIDTYLRKKSREINEKEFTSKLLELFVGKRLISFGYNAKMNICLEKDNKPLDIITVIDGKEYLIECNRIKHDESFKHIISCFTDFPSVLHLWKKNGILKKGQTAFDLCGFIKIDKSDYHTSSGLKEQLYLKLKKFELDTYSELNDTKNIILEEYTPAIYNKYPNLLKNAKYGLMFQIKSTVQKQNIHFDFQYELLANGINWNQKILNNLRTKQEQHKEFKDFEKIYVFEIEMYHGAILPTDIKHINQKQLEQKLDMNENFVLIFKDSRQTEIIRKSLILSRDEKLKKTLNRILCSDTVYDFGIKTSLYSI